MDNQQSTNQTQHSDPGAILPPLQQDDTQAAGQSSLPPLADPMQGATTAMPPSVPPQINITPVGPNQTVPSSRALVPTPESAADSDLIEKEWVEKAKQIVQHTATDPFAQQEQLSKMKADYMKKRYNKDIGTS